MVYGHKISKTDRSGQLKRLLVDCWAQLSQDTLNPASDQLPNGPMMVITAKGVRVQFHLN